jgi:hypothetical protein
MSEAALFSIKLASQLIITFFIDFFIGSRSGSGTGSGTAMHSGSVSTKAKSYGSYVPFPQNCHKGPQRKNVTNS